MLLLPAPAVFGATILVYGDSLSAGYGLPREAGWASLLQKRLQDERLNYKVVNASISGETTLGGKNRIAGALTAHKPSVVILALGANDGLRGQSPETMRANLETIIQDSERSNARVLLVGMRMPPNYGAAYAEKFHATFGEIAKRRKLPFVPFLLDGFAENRELFQADGVHPTAQAQPLMLETVWKTLRPMLKKR
ncbi:MAG: arylesterase [Burkholderiales bacterium]|nr:arylesterase [Burkholderiales bacterium]